MLSRIWTGVGSHISHFVKWLDWRLHFAPIVMQFSKRIKPSNVFVQLNLWKHSHFDALFLSSGWLTDFSLMLLLLLFYQSFMNTNKCEFLVLMAGRRFITIVYMCVCIRLFVLCVFWNDSNSSKSNQVNKSEWTFRKIAVRTGRKFWCNKTRMPFIVIFIDFPW